MPRGEQFSFDNMDNDQHGLASKRKGLYLSPLAVVMYVLVTLFLAAAVGVIVYFTKPCRRRQIEEDGLTKVTSLSDVTSSMTTAWLDSISVDDMWMICLNISMAKNECLPGAIPCSRSDVYGQVDYRLPSTFRPRHYDIEIKPNIYESDPSNFSYEGSVVIFLECIKPSDVIFVHFREMIIDEPVIVRNSLVDVGVNRTEINNVTEFFQIFLERSINAGENISVTLNYHGKLTFGASGMFYNNYVYENETKYQVGTQLEATDARRTFPCLDEPALKATFRLTLWRKEPLTALTNTPLVRSENKSDGWIRDTFDVTPVVMSTYLVAFAITDYKHIERTTTGGLTEKLVRIWSRPDYIEKGYLNYSLDVSLKMFDYFEEYFDFPYDFPKQDQISLAFFLSGAMENWGLVVYREERIVYDPNHVTLYHRQRMTATISHELLHQWIGNVVTCHWWSDLWLNEGMARYYQYLALPSAQPDWDIDQLFAVQVFYLSIKDDQGDYFRAMQASANSPNDIEAMFNFVTYDKAACVIRMMKEQVLGDSFQEAMRKYLRQNAYRAVTPGDLFRAWDEQAEIDDLHLEVNMSQVMDTWIQQARFPVVTMERIDVNSVRLTQTVFVQNAEDAPHTKHPAPYNYTWDIPLTYVTNINPNSINLEWLHRENKTITLHHSLSSADWLLGNYRQHGYYLINYDVNNWNALIAQLKSDHEVFHVTNRGQLIHDSFNLARSMHLDYVIALKVTEYLENETSYLPWAAAADRTFNLIDKLLRYSVDFPIFQKYVRNLMMKNYKALGWEIRPQDTHDDIYLRHITVSESCKYGNVDCIQTALDYFRRWKEDPKNTTIIPPEIRKAVYCTAIRHGLTSDWHFLFNVYKNFEHFSDEKGRQRMALTCTRDRPTLTRLFHMVQYTDKELVSHDVGGLKLIGQFIATSYLGADVVWEALNNDPTALKGRFSILHKLSESFTTQYDLEKFDTFVAKHSSDDNSATFEPLRNIILHNIRWRSENENAIFSWLRNVTEAYT